MGKGQNPTLEALKKIRKGAPFPWKGVDSDNGHEFINYHLINYCEKENLELDLPPLIVPLVRLESMER